MTDYPHLGQIVTVTGTVRAVELLWRDGRCRVTVDADFSTYQDYEAMARRIADEVRQAIRPEGDES